MATGGRSGWICGLGGLAFALAIGAGDARANTRILAAAGNWEAYSTISSQGDRLCGISQFSNGLGMLIKHAEGQGTLWFEVLNRGWRIPPGTEVRVSVEIDGRGVFSGMMRRSETQHDTLGHTFPDLAQGLAFVRRFADGRRMRVIFHEGTEGDWGASLSGTRRVTDAFAQCIIRLYPQQPSQPFNSRAPDRDGAQPFDVAPAPQAGPPKSPAP